MGRADSRHRLASVSACAVSALSRSDKKVLHVDKNEYYGGADAALTLQDAEEWSKQVHDGDGSLFKNAFIERHGDSESSKLGFSRSYSLALSPQIIYTRSALLPTLVSSKVYRQLDFLAVGGWFIFTRGQSEEEVSLKRIPSSREDIFADKTLDIKSKRALISFLRSIRDPEEERKLVEDHKDEKLFDFLSSRYKLPPHLISAVSALTLSQSPASKTTLGYALPRVMRHMTSMGVFGPGFGAVVPKWGGLAEIAQVACRAQAVGGGTYMLGKAVEAFRDDLVSREMLVRLDEDTEVTTRSICAGSRDLPHAENDEKSCSTFSYSISVVGDALDCLFLGVSEAGPKPTVAVVCFPEGSIGSGKEYDWPTYLMVHSSDTGECPAGQCIIYGSVHATGGKNHQILKEAVDKLLVASGKSSDSVLWTLNYQREQRIEPSMPKDNASPSKITFGDNSHDLAFDDNLLQVVRHSWQQISGQDVGFMDFEDREVGAYDEDE